VWHVDLWHNGVMAAVGYARVSTLKQVNDRQDDSLAQYGVDRVFRDKYTGVKFDRPGLTALLDYVREGDTVVVASFDRLGRNLVECVQTANTLLERGIVLKSVKEGIDFSTSTGRMLAGVFASLAQYERELMLERMAEARQAAKDRGLATGRPARLNEDQRRQVQRLHAAGESVPQLVTTFNVSRRTIYRALEATQPA
jgi:DNA invertase Pin-like site-specific DNA recombinase